MVWHIDEHEEALWADFTTPELLQRLVREVYAQEYVAIDTETTGLVVWKELVLFWSIAWQLDNGAIRRVFMPRATLSLFKDSFDDPEKKWVFVNAKFDMHMLENVGVRLAGSCVDVSVMHALLYPDAPHGLKQMHQQIMGWTWRSFEEVVGLTNMNKLGETLLSMWQTNRKLLVEYGGNDALGTLNLFLKLAAELRAAPTWSAWPEQIPTLWEYFELTEVPFTRTLYRMERAGMLVDLEYLATRRKPIQDRIHELERAIVRLRGRPININSGDQLRSWFIDDLKLTSNKMTKGGKTGVRKISIDDEFLSTYSNIEPVKLVKEVKDLNKLLSTYIDGLADLVDPQGRVHGRFNQDIARTGRLSSSSPNLQNFPRPDNDPFRVRRAFIAPKGKKILARDYSQLEMVLLGNASGDEKLLSIFREKKDIHMGNAYLVLAQLYKQKYNVTITYESLVHAKAIEKKVKEGKLAPEEITYEIERNLFARQAVKSIAYGTNYGMKPKKLAGELGCPIEEAEELYNAYMGAYPAVNKFFDECVEIAQRTGYAFTLLGRRRYLPEIHSHNSFDRFEAQRRAGNTRIQGSAADVVKMAMLKITASQLEEQYGAPMISQVHDELLFEIPDEVLEEVNAKITDCMDHPFETDLPVQPVTEGGIAQNWADAK